jgi:hypothetical protein
MNMGEVIPFCHREMLPGDVAEISVDGLIRFSPLVAPLMHRVKASFLWMWVPTRIIDTTFEDFITGGADGNDTTTPPTISTSTAAKGTIYDYLGVPIVDNLSFSAHPVRAYNACYNEFIRDQDLQQTEVTQDSTAIQYVMWQKDYFTQARPAEQKGTAVTISIGDEATVMGIGFYSQGATATAYSSVEQSDLSSGSLTGMKGMDASSAVNGESQIIFKTQNTNYPDLTADLSTATGVSVNDLKEAWAFQKFMENRYKFGSRYSEFVKHLGGYDGNARLERPEFISASSANISFSEVLQTAPDSGTSTVVGEMKGHGITGIKGRRAFKYFGEHGHLLGLMFIRPEAIYTNGLHRKFSRTDKEDYYNPEFADIGWQEIYNREIYAQGTGGGSDDASVFGYCPRYDDYRSEPNFVAGDFRDTLDTHHLARQLSSLPTLNQAFISTSGTIRNSDIFASTAKDTIWVTVNNRIKSRRIVTPRQAMEFQRL